MPPHLTELIVLAVGPAGMLALSLATLRPAALAQTFNDMLDRLESERRESAGRAR